jgi:hypothetical protein
MKKIPRRYFNTALMILMFICTSILISCTNHKAGINSLSIKGAVKDQQTFSLSDLKKNAVIFSQGPLPDKRKDNMPGIWRGTAVSS